VPRLKAIDTSIPIIILTGYGSIDFAVEAVKLGADMFLPKPAELSTLYVMIQRSLENQRSHRQQLAERNRNSRVIVSPFLGTSESIRRLADLAHKVAQTDDPVLIQGEDGTDQANIARWVHHNSSRAFEPFLKVICRDLSPDLLETDLFGDGRDTLDGTMASKAGILDIAHKGTIFLDEIEDVDSQAQLRLFYALEDYQFQKLDDVRDRSVDIRLIAAQKGVAAVPSRKQFRRDLHERIKWTHLFVPALRERIEDIPILSAQILRQLTGQSESAAFTLGPDAVMALQAYSWPGNVRELRNVLERVVLVSGKDAWSNEDFRFDTYIEQCVSGVGQFRTLEQMERDYIHQVLRKEHGRVRAAAKKLGIPRSSLYHKLKQYKTDQPQIPMQTMETANSRNLGVRPPRL
jgi:DNA-binding NtrC family response regulator